MSDKQPLPKAVLFNNKTPPHIFTLVMLAGIGALNMNIILPSLPALAKYFAEDYSVIQLALSAYLAMTAILQLIVGPLSDRYGRRPMIIGSFIIFTLASLITAMATTFEMYMVGRLIQAIVVTGYTLSRAIIRDMVPMHKAASMIGYVTMGMALVPMVGPTIGGFFEEAMGWQSVNYFVAVLGALMFALVWIDLGETNLTPSTSFGAQFSEYPELFSSRRFWGYTLSAMFASGSYFAFLGGAPYAGENYFGLSPSEIGMYFGTIAIGYMFGNFLSGRFSQKYGIAKMMLSGGIIVTTGIFLSILLFSFGATHPTAFFIPIMAVGMGNGMTLPSTMAGMVSVRPHLAGSASGLGGAMMIGGGAALSVLAGFVLTPSSGPLPLLIVMLVSAFLSILSILFTSRVERSIGTVEDVS